MSLLDACGVRGPLFKSRFIPFLSVPEFSLSFCTQTMFTERELRMISLNIAPILQEGFFVCGGVFVCVFLLNYKLLTPHVISRGKVTFLRLLCDQAHGSLQQCSVFDFQI